MDNIFKRLLVAILCLNFLFGNADLSFSASSGLMSLPEPGVMVGPSALFTPLSLKGLVINPKKPLEFQFIVDTGNSGLSVETQNFASFQNESQRLIKYFLAGLTIPEGDLWVNLSPYEKDRITPTALGETELGHDLLAQDYILKQLTASLIYPEKDLGKEFWSRVYQQAKEKFGTANVPVNTFNKVWILPDEAQVFENKGAVYVTKSTLKVMLDEDYLAMNKHNVGVGSKPTHMRAGLPDVGVGSKPTHMRAGLPAGQAGLEPAPTDSNYIGSKIIRDIVIPEITKEINTGKNFAPLRQIYSSLILAKWYKETIQNGLLDSIYTNKSKILGINLSDPAMKQKIYERYLQAYKKGVFNYIKEDEAPTGQKTPRKYFSGGAVIDIDLKRTNNKGMISSEGSLLALQVRLNLPNAAMTVLEEFMVYPQRAMSFDEFGLGLLEELEQGHRVRVHVFAPHTIQEYISWQKVMPFDTPQQRLAHQIVLNLYKQQKIKSIQLKADEIILTLKERVMINDKSLGEIHLYWPDSQEIARPIKQRFKSVTEMDLLLDSEKLTDSDFIGKNFTSPNAAIQKLLALLGNFYVLGIYDYQVQTAEDRSVLLQELTNDQAEREKYAQLIIAEEEYAKVKRDLELAEKEVQQKLEQLRLVAIKEAEEQRKSQERLIKQRAREKFEKYFKKISHSTYVVPSFLIPFFQKMKETRGSKSIYLALEDYVSDGSIVRMYPDLQGFKVDFYDGELKDPNAKEVLMDLLGSINPLNVIDQENLLKNPESLYDFLISAAWEEETNDLRLNDKIYYDQYVFVGQYLHTIFKRDREEMINKLLNSYKSTGDELDLVMKLWGFPHFIHSEDMGIFDQFFQSVLTETNMISLGGFIKYADKSAPHNINILKLLGERYRGWVDERYMSTFLCMVFMELPNQVINRFELMKQRVFDLFSIELKVNMVNIEYYIRERQIRNEKTVIKWLGGAESKLEVLMGGAVGRQKRLAGSSKSLNQAMIVKNKEDFSTGADLAMANEGGVIQFDSFDHFEAAVKKGDLDAKARIIVASSAVLDALLIELREAFSDGVAFNILINAVAKLKGEDRKVFKDGKYAWVEAYFITKGLLSKGHPSPLPRGGIKSELRIILQAAIEGYYKSLIDFNEAPEFLLGDHIPPYIRIFGWAKSIYTYTHSPKINKRVFSTKKAATQYIKDYMMNQKITDESLIRGIINILNPWKSLNKKEKLWFFTEPELKINHTDKEILIGLMEKEVRKYDPRTIAKALEMGDSLENQADKEEILGIIKNTILEKLTSGFSQFQDDKLDRVIEEKAKKVGVFLRLEKIENGYNQDRFGFKLVDMAMMNKSLNAPGGIDLNPVHIHRTGKTIAVQFDPAQLNALMQGGFEGFSPVIINIRPIESPLPLLGVASRREESDLAKI